jgi:hypothetical protein
VHTAAEGYRHHVNIYAYGASSSSRSLSRIPSHRSFTHGDIRIRDGQCDLRGISDSTRTTHACKYVARGHAEFRNEAVRAIRIPLVRGSDTLGGMSILIVEPYSVRIRHRVIPILPHAFLSQLLEDHITPRRSRIEVEVRVIRTIAAAIRASVAASCI